MPIKVKSLAAIVQAPARPQAQPIVCPRCQKSFRSAGWFARHQCAGSLAARAANTIPIPGATPIGRKCACGRVFTISTSFNRHRKKCGWHLIKAAMAADARKGSMR